jgi:hypothetical protein
VLDATNEIVVGVRNAERAAMRTLKDDEPLRVDVPGHRLRCVGSRFE